MKLSKNIWLYEVECGCGCGSVAARPSIIDSMLILGFEKLRTFIGNKPIRIHKGGGYRCPEYHERGRLDEIKTKMSLYGLSAEELYERRLIWHSLNSPHSSGTALDIDVSGIPHLRLFAYAVRMGFGGVGLYPWGVHIDTRKEFTVWDRS